MATKIVRTVIGGQVIETPVLVADVPEPEEKKATKAKTKKAAKDTEPEPASEACGLKLVKDD